MFNKEVIANAAIAIFLGIPGMAFVIPLGYQPIEKTEELGYVYNWQELEEEEKLVKVCRNKIQDHNTTSVGNWSDVETNFLTKESSVDVSAYREDRVDGSIETRIRCSSKDGEVSVFEMYNIH